MQEPEQPAPLGGTIPTSVRRGPCGLCPRGGGPGVEATHVHAWLTTWPGGEQGKNRKGDPPAKPSPARKAGAGAPAGSGKWKRGPGCGRYPHT